MDEGLIVALDRREIEDGQSGDSMKLPTAVSRTPPVLEFFNSTIGAPSHRKKVAGLPRIKGTSGRGRGP